MPTTISTTDARKHFADIVNRVAYGRKSIILTRRGVEMAALVSMEEYDLLRKLEDFVDTEDARKAMAEQGENIPAGEFWSTLGL